MTNNTSALFSIPTNPTTTTQRWSMQFPYNLPLPRDYKNDPILLNLLSNCLRLSSNNFTKDNLPTLPEHIFNAYNVSSSSSASAATSTSTIASSSFILPSIDLLQEWIYQIYYNVRTKKLIIHLYDQYYPLLALFQPDTNKLGQINQSNYVNNQRITGISITVKYPSTVPSNNHQNQNIDFASRYFSPWNGISEDPVNGSSHTLLGPYWCNILNRFTDTKNNENALLQRKGTVIGYQQSSRTGILYINVQETRTNETDITSVDDANNFVMLGGYAVTISSGKLVL